MKRGQVFVRAVSPSGKWYSADVLDLDEASFRAFVIEMLHRHGLVVGISPEHATGDSIEYHSTKEPE